MGNKKGKKTHVQNCRRGRRTKNEKELEKDIRTATSRKNGRFYLTEKNRFFLELMTETEPARYLFDLVHQRKA